MTTVLYDIHTYLGSLHLAQITQLEGVYNTTLQRNCLLYNFEPVNPCGYRS